MNPTPLQEFHIGTKWEEFELSRLRLQKGLKTGFSQFDQKVITLPGFTTIMGDTGVGKSAFVSNIILYNAQKGHPVLLFDNEVGLTETRKRLLCILGDLTFGAIESNVWYDNEKERYEKATKELCQLPIYYLPELSEESLETTIIEAGKTHQKHVLVVIDSIHAFIQGGDKERDELTKWSNLFNTIKNKYEGKVTIIMLSEKAKAQYGAESNGAAGSRTIDFRSELTINMYQDKEASCTYLKAIKHRKGKKGIISVLYPPEPFTYKLEEREYLQPDES